ncbi:hypothetical protein PC128_g7116 [Phytophthora cactorum]|nr:hypothetical protein PC128_g7116 [Phytophthora cactorum]
MEDTIARIFPGLRRCQVRSKKRLCYNWKVSKELIEAMCALGLGSHQRSPFRGAGATQPAAVEGQLVRWVNDLRVDGVRVTGMMLTLQGQVLYKTTGLPRGAVTASWSLRKPCLRRHKLGIRRMTRKGQATPVYTSEKLVAFSCQVLAKMKELRITKVYNAGQTGNMVGLLAFCLQDI